MKSSENFSLGGLLATNTKRANPITKVITINIITNLSPEVTAFLVLFNTEKLGWNLSSGVNILLLDQLKPTNIIIRMKRETTTEFNVIPTGVKLRPKPKRATSAMLNPRLKAVLSNISISDFFAHNALTREYPGRNSRKGRPNIILNMFPSGRTSANTRRRIESITTKARSIPMISWILLWILFSESI
jgi:hypothetical protein